jgi:hypothetical protein
VKFAEEQKNIFRPAEPSFLPETPQIQALRREFVEFQEEIKVVLAEKCCFILQKSFHVV